MFTGPVVPSATEGIDYGISFIIEMSEPGSPADTGFSGYFLNGDVIQGFYFSKPLPPDEFAKLFDK